MGAFLGVVIGGSIVAAADSMSPPPPAPSGESAIEAATFLLLQGANGIAFTGAMLCGAGIGGIIGGIGGSVLGAGVAARASSTLARDFPSPMGSSPADVPEPALESPDAELARLKERVAELEAKKW
jgi:hypothetical protein